MNKLLIVSALGFCALSARASFTYGYIGGFTSYGKATVSSSSQILDSSFTISVYDTTTSTLPTVTLGITTHSVYAGLLTTPTGSALDQVADPFTAFSITSPTTGSTLAVSKTGVDTTFDVSFTLQKAKLAPTGEYTIFFDPTLNFSPHNGGTKSDTEAYIQIDVVPAPEPGQMVAGGILVGFSGFILLGRRLIKKQAS